LDGEQNSYFWVENGLKRTIPDGLLLMMENAWGGDGPFVIIGP